MIRTLANIVAAGSIILMSAASAAVPVPFTAKTIDGNRFPSAEQAGAVIIVNFWATWCAPCRTEMPALDAYFRRHKADGLALLAISVDAGASVKKLGAATSAYSFQVTRLDDVKMPRSAIPTALPATRVYDRDGILRFDSASMKGQPVLDEALLERVVTPLLAPDATAR